MTHSHLKYSGHAVLRGAAALALCISCCGGLLAAGARAAHAQNEVLPKEVAALYDDVSDIDKLRILNPLKLTADQLDSIIAAVKQSQDAYNKKLADAAVPPIRDMAAQVKETRRQLITSGGDVPKDFDAKVKAIQDRFLKERNQADYDALKGLSDKIRGILTPDQIATAVSLARDYEKKQGQTVSKGQDDKYFNFYVLGTFILYPRIVPLLEEMRDAKRGAAAGAPPVRVARAAGGASGSRGTHGHAR